MLRRRLGISLVETAMSIGIMGIMLGSFAIQQSEQAQRERAWTAADRMKEIQGWVARFLDVNGQILLRTLVAGNVTAMAIKRGGPGDGNGLPSLEEAGFVPEGFRDMTTYGHSHAILMRSNTSGAITALIVQVGGRKLEDKDLGRMVQRLGSSGGGRFTNPVRREDQEKILGNSGGWSLDAREWTASGISVTEGRAVVRVDLITGTRNRSVPPPNPNGQTGNPTSNPNPHPTHTPSIPEILQ
jgi:hypothetical protein